MDDLKQGTQILAADGKPSPWTLTWRRIFGREIAWSSIRKPGFFTFRPPKSVRPTVAVDDAAAAFSDMGGAIHEAIIAFYDHAANALADDVVWYELAAVNGGDVQNAGRHGRTTTRLGVSESVRKEMIEGLRG